MTITRRCPACRATYWDNARHICPRRDQPPAPAARSRSLILAVVIAVAVVAALCAMGWPG